MTERDRLGLRGLLPPNVVSSQPTDRPIQRAEERFATVRGALVKRPNFDCERPHPNSHENGTSMDLIQEVKRGREDELHLSFMKLP
ncbi:Os06g0536800 [Oryza sativa Japonica Group]|uniref:Os06g0536800 protein n=1 Tax=Oryza sativa subsp. japonica TaxID=39947 RepID=C7J4F0_ORYSJ|nr:Os06g0536800 [Oryza sativa Japonica Group]|eukprot:NP_001174834.1 Os06g0536800 [Oryza sativa Japonica Group]